MDAGTRVSLRISTPANWRNGPRSGHAATLTALLLPLNIAELRTPAALVDADILAANLALMAHAWPWERLRPHVKARKCTELARRRVTGEDVSFHDTSFEGLDAADSSFDLFISSAAFHWVDPDIALTKSARLLRPGGLRCA